METGFEDHGTDLDEMAEQNTKHNIFMMKFKKPLSSDARMNTQYFIKKVEFHKLWNEETHKMLRGAFHHKYVLSANGIFSKSTDVGREACGLAIKNMINNTAQEENPIATVFVDGILQPDLNVNAFAQSLSLKKILTNYSVFETLQLGAKTGLIHGIRIRDPAVDQLYTLGEQIPIQEDVRCFWGKFEKFEEPKKRGPSSSGPSSGGPSSGGPSSGGPSSGGPSDSGPSSGGPSDSGPSDSGPSDSGPSASGPSASGPSASGPSASGPSSGGPSSTRCDGKACSVISSVQKEQCAEKGQDSCYNTAEAAGETSSPSQKAVSIGKILDEEERRGGIIRSRSDDEILTKKKKVKAQM